MAAPLKVGCADLRPRLQSAGPDRRLRSARSPDSPVEDRAGAVQPARRAGPGARRQGRPQDRDRRSQGFPDREDFDVAMDREIRAAGAEFVVPGRLHAPADRRSSSTAWKDKLVNIHPALLPSFPGLDTHAPRAGGRACASTAPPSISCGTRPTPARSSRRPPCRCCPAMTRAPSPRACCRPSTGSIPLALRLIAEGKVRVEGERAIVSDARSADGALFNPAPS